MGQPIQKPKTKTPMSNSKIARRANAGVSAADRFKQEEKEVEKRKAQGFAPFRFRMKQGEECEITILDDTPIEEMFGIQEHQIQGSDGKYNVFETCCKEIGNCPVCKQHGDSNYTCFLSILVHKPWTSTKTGEKHEFSKMLLPIKRNQYEPFERLYQIAVKKGEGLRGMTILMKRPNEDKSSAIGLPIPNDDGQAYYMMTEDELEEDYGHKEIRSRDKKTILKPANDSITPYDYEKLFPEPDEDEMNERYGVEVAGSRRSNAKGWQDTDDNENEDAEPPKSATTARRRRRASTEEEEPEATPTPARRRRAAPVAPVEDADDDDFEDVPF